MTTQDVTPLPLEEIVLITKRAQQRKREEMISVFLANEEARKHIKDINAAMMTEAEQGHSNASIQMLFPSVVSDDAHHGLFSCLDVIYGALGYTVTCVRYPHKITVCIDWSKKT